MLTIEALPIEWSRFLQLFRELEKYGKEGEQVSIKVTVQDRNVTLTASTANNHSVLGMKQA